MPDQLGGQQEDSKAIGAYLWRGTVQVLDSRDRHYEDKGSDFHMCEFKNDGQGLIAQKVCSNNGENYSGDDANDDSFLVQSSGPQPLLLKTTARQEYNFQWY